MPRLQSEMTAAVVGFALVDDLSSYSQITQKPSKKETNPTQTHSTATVAWQQQDSHRTHEQTIQFAVI